MRTPREPGWFHRCREGMTTRRNLLMMMAAAAATTAAGCKMAGQGDQTASVGVPDVLVGDGPRTAWRWSGRTAGPGRSGRDVAERVHAGRREGRVACADLDPERHEYRQICPQRELAAAGGVHLRRPGRADRARPRRDPPEPADIDDNRLRGRRRRGQAARAGRRGRTRRLRPPTRTVCSCWNGCRPPPPTTTAYAGSTSCPGSWPRCTPGTRFRRRPVTRRRCAARAGPAYRRPIARCSTRCTRTSPATSTHATSRRNPQSRCPRLRAYVAA